ncbi:putative holin-like toxin [Alkaliphilus oremlandii]|nr:putative holin-like toxin [Alkaliphilus oremlandii]
MDTYQAISLMITFGMLLISLISLIVNLTKDNNKGKK